MAEELDSRASYDQGNYYERRSTLALNVEMLGLKGIRAPGLESEVPDVRQPSVVQRTRMREIIRECNSMHSDWGFKDPRTCLTYNLWASELPVHRIIAIYRPPGEIWPRFRQESWRRFYRHPLRAWTFLKGWCRYNANILSCLKNTDMDFLVLSYPELVTNDTEFNRLEEFVGIELSDQREPALYRRRVEESPWIQIMTWPVYRQMGCRPSDSLQQFDALRHEGRQRSGGHPNQFKKIKE
jgi:hypothetical protein